MLRKPTRNAIDMALKPKEINTDNVKGTLPFNVGLAGGAKNITPEALDEIRRIASEIPPVPEEEKRKAITPPTPINIDTLPQEKFDEISKAIKEAKELKPQYGPGIGEAIKTAEKAAKHKAEPPKEKETPKDTLLEPTETNKANGTCIHCGWPVDRSDGTDPTQFDKQLFVAAVLGQKRFTKEYKLFNGQFKVSFRTLTVNESDLVIKQLVKDWNDGKIVGPAQSIAEATRYQLMLSLDSVDTNVGVVPLPPFEEYTWMPNDVPENGTALPLLAEHITQEVLKMEPLRRAVAKAYGHFLDTISKLESMAESDSFWAATVE